MMQWNINLQREIAPATVVTVGYVGTRGKNFFKQRDVNPVQPRTVNGQTVYGTAARGPRRDRAEPAAQPGVLEPELRRGDRRLRATNSLQLSLNRRFYENLPGAGVVHAVEVRGHQLRQLRRRGWHGVNQPVRSGIRPRPVRLRPDARAARQRRLRAAVHRQRVRRRVAGQRHHQSEQRRAVHADRRRHLGSWHRRPAPEPGAGRAASTTRCRAASPSTSIRPCS